MFYLNFEFEGWCKGDCWIFSIIIYLNNFLILIWNEIYLFEIIKESMMLEFFKYFNNIWIGYMVFIKILGILFCVELKGF